MIEYLNVLFSFLIGVNAVMIFGIFGSGKIYKCCNDDLLISSLIVFFFVILMACITLCLFVGATSLFNAFGVLWLGYIIGVLGIAIIDYFFTQWAEDMWC